jgi:hypothetical protein
MTNAVGFRAGLPPKCTGEIGSNQRNGVLSFVPPVKVASGNMAGMISHGI